MVAGVRLFVYSGIRLLPWRGCYRAFRNQGFHLLFLFQTDIYIIKEGHDLVSTNPLAPVVNES